MEISKAQQKLYIGILIGAQARIRMRVPTTSGVRWQMPARAVPQRSGESPLVMRCPRRTDEVRDSKRQSSASNEPSACYSSASSRFSASSLPSPCRARITATPTTGG